MQCVFNLSNSVFVVFGDEPVKSQQWISKLSLIRELNRIENRNKRTDKRSKKRDEEMRGKTVTICHSSSNLRGRSLWPDYL